MPRTSTLHPSKVTLCFAAYATISALDAIDEVFVAGVRGCQLLLGAPDEPIRLLAHVSEILAEHGILDIGAGQEMQPRRRRVFAVVIRLQPAERL